MRNLIGAILMAVGVLIAGTAGLCALASLFGTLGSLLSGSLNDLFSIVRILGGPILVGLGIFWAGRRIQRGGSRDHFGGDN